LPVAFQHKICGLVSDAETGGISVTVRSDASTSSDKDRWLADFQFASKMTFRVEQNRLSENPSENLYHVSTSVYIARALSLYLCSTGSLKFWPHKLTML